MAHQCSFTPQSQVSNCNSTGIFSVSELNNEHLDAADIDDTKCFIFDQVVVESQFVIEEPVVHESEKYYDDINSFYSSQIKQVVKKEEQIMDNETVTKNNSEVQILRRSPRIQALNRQKQNQENNLNERSSNVPKANFVTSKQKKGKKKTKNMDTNNTSMFRKNIQTYSRLSKKMHESVPESIVRTSSDEMGETIFSFKMKGKDGLEHIPERNLTENMRKMVINYFNNQLQRLRDVSVLTETETSANNNLSHNLEIPDSKLIKKTISDFKKKQLACLAKENFCKENGLDEYAIDIKLTI